MRSWGLSRASLAAAVLLAFAPTAAFAHWHRGHGHAWGHWHLRGHSHRGYYSRCRINIESVAPRLITAGESAEVSGRLACTRRSSAGVTVELYAHSAGTPGFTPVQSTTTEADGAYKFTTAAEEVNTRFFVRALGAQSATKRLWVAAAVTLTGPAEGTQIETGVPETFSGTVTPADVGARVVLQRENAVVGDEWHRIGSGSVEPGGTYSIVHMFRVPGDASIRVLVRSDGINVPSGSNILEYEISQMQNPQLTIATTQDPITYGQPVTISGTLAGATEGQPVTLFARTKLQRGFAPIAEVKTGPGGSYSFAGQQPLYSTLYQARAGRVRSAILYESVEAVLTAEVSATTVEAGQPVTFSGTVAPDDSGHVIYLEAENASHTAFHVIQVARVLPGSTYSIIHQFYVPGTKVVRVEVPGGPRNGRAVSQPFTIQVTPAPASMLAPETPGNTSQPPAGQVEGAEREPALSK
jgi:hypothetical protein